ncbi:NADH/Ubiquinone/plastoquinone (complex I) [Isosphaera pallida ATCC 43644]|uniref:NADH/Ubiquinone/plastoquinone (Complex I) n=1 Tax=Isosphaera pallida (strain ATCC 43644 / DSM 9630 / IS1B) TaxID=575540 RepID=E8QXY2_ISOPI|nr:proton-conducting transporter membrane subunit [Isosphaera pallida]ADV60961.1 NADH/Ubiquinone/plastoquinone (complex I) [Isosphaera pallida ATCC 43644]
MLWTLLLIPTLSGIAAFGIQRHPLRRILLLTAAVGQFAVTARLWMDWPQRPAPILDGWIGLDALGLLVLTICGVLFLAAAVYALGYLEHENHGSLHRDFEEGSLFVNEPEAVFTGCLLLFLASMNLVTLSRHFGLMWVAVEATTLFSAPLIYFHRHRRSLEATWKYVLICSVGIALAMLGNFALAAARPPGTAHGNSALLVDDLIALAPQMNPLWLQLAFIFFLVGYGTKMGLAPFHTWLPDAHSEAPSLVSALMSGALLNCAFLGVLRGHQVCLGAGQGLFSRELLVGFGLLSLLVAGVFIVGQTDFKRMLAYSSVEHMGILALAVGLGAGYAAGLHAVNHSLAKGALFLTAGNLLASYRTKSVVEVTGVLARLPLTGWLWLAGILAITGTPPFGIFLSEFAILRSIVDQQRPWVAGAYLFLLAVIFLGMIAIAIPMTHRGPSQVQPARLGQVEADHTPTPWLMKLPPLVLLGGVLALGLHLPSDLTALLREIADSLTEKGS